MGILLRGTYPDQVNWNVSSDSIKFKMTLYIGLPARMVKIFLFMMENKLSKIE